MNLIEAATLTPEERGQHIRYLRDDGTLFSSSLEYAARDKALWAVVEWLGTQRIRFTAVAEDVNISGEGFTNLGARLANQLTAAGIRRPL